MSYSERILETLIGLTQINEYGLFDAAADYCETHSIDIDEFVATLDRNVIERIKLDAVNSRKVRRCVQQPTARLV